MGVVRGTQYALPLDPTALCFANIAILAGIGHGKSTIAGLLAAQFSLMGKKVLVLDPTGEWVMSLTHLKDKLAEVAKVGISVSSHTIDQIDYRAEGRRVIPSWKEASNLPRTLKTNQITLVDLSLAKTDLNSDEKLRARCQITYEIHDTLMGLALREYAEKHTPYGSQTCVILEEAHQFVPAKSEIPMQQRL